MDWFVEAGRVRRAAAKLWSTPATDKGASYDKTVMIDASEIVPCATWGTSSEDVMPITGSVPDPNSFEDLAEQAAARQSLQYMGLTPGTLMRDIAVENIFIGSCTNSRIENLRAAAAVLQNRRIAPNVRQALVVPGSGLVRQRAEAEGLP